MCLSLKCAELAYKQAAQPVYVGPNPDPFTVLVAECDEDMIKLLKALLSNGSIPNWAGDMTELLIKYHAQAHLLGQGKWDLQSQFLATSRATQIVQLGRTFINPRTLEQLYSPAELDWLEGFVRNLQDGDPRYFDESGVLKSDQVLGRMRMYQGKLRGTEGFGVLDASPLDELWQWTLGGAEDHCEDCPYNASLVPVTRDEWYTTPGAGDTPCLMNCKCSLVAVKSGVATADPIERIAA